ncbi:unnamed protein product [Eretmochelys imbricata]
MKGIEENVLRRRGQDKGLAGEGKPKNSSGIASWFGLRRSKLPALSRRPEGLPAKGERKQWGGGGERKVAAGKLEAESLNISKLMEKAEDLRKALEAEKAYINGLALEKGRPPRLRHPHGADAERAPGHVPGGDGRKLHAAAAEQGGREGSLREPAEQKRELRDFQRVSHDIKDPGSSGPHGTASSAICGAARRPPRRAQTRSSGRKSHRTTAWPSP